MAWRPQLLPPLVSSKEFDLTRKPKKPKISQKSSQPVSQKTVNQPEVLWWPQLGWPVASSKEVQVSRKSKQVESQP